MADKRNRSQHRGPGDRPDLTWPVWAEKYAPPTANSSIEQTSRHVNDDVMRIRHQDIGLYGLCPRQDECCLVVCNHCKQLIRLQALYSHYERRHSQYLTNSRHQNSSTHKEAYKNTNTNGPYAPPDTLRHCERRDSSSGSSDRVHSSAKEAKVSSSKRKPSLSSQWDSDDSSSELRTENYSDYVSKYIGSYNRDDRRHRSGGSNEVSKRRSTDISVGLSETPKSFSKNSVQVNGVKVVGSSSDLSRSAGVPNSRQAASTTSTSKSSKHVRSSSQALSETIPVEKPSKSHLAKSESNRLSLEAREPCDSSSKTYSNNSLSSVTCRAKDLSIGTKEKLSSVSYSSRSSHARDSSGSAKLNAKDSSKTLKSYDSSSSSAVRSDGSHGKSKHPGTVEPKSHSDHHQTSGTISVSLPAVSRSSSSEDHHRGSTVSKSADVPSSSKMAHHNSRAGTTKVETRVSARTSVSKDSVFNFSDASASEHSKAVPNSSDEPSWSSSSRSASKAVSSHSGPSQDLSQHSSQQHSSKSSHRLASQLNSVVKSGSVHSPDVSKSKSETKSESKLNLESKVNDSLSSRTCSVERRNIPTSSQKEHLTDDVYPALACVTVEPESPRLRKSPENATVVNCSSKRVPELRDKPKSSSQFCKDREFDPDKHCGVICSDTGKPCTHSLTCKIHALSLRRSVPGRTKPFDQLLSDHRLLKDAVRKRHEIQQKSKPLNETSKTHIQATSLSPSSNTESLRIPPVSDVKPASENTSASCLQPPGNQSSARLPRPRPKPRFRTSLFQSSRWFSVLASASGSREKQITRPVKLPLFHANGTIKLSDDANPTINGDAGNIETSSSYKSHQNSSFLLHHPRPVAINRFGAWKIGQGCSVFNRKEDLSRSIFEEMLESHLNPPPYKKLCVEANLPVEISDSREPSLRDPYQFASGVVPSSKVVMSSTSSSSPSSAVLPPVRKHASKSKTHSSPLSSTFPGATTFRSTGAVNAAKTSESFPTVPLDSSNSVARLSSQHYQSMNHRYLSTTNTVVPSVDASNLTPNKILSTDRTRNSLSGGVSNAHLQNGLHLSTGSLKKRSQCNETDDKWYSSDSGKQKILRTSDGPKVRTDESKAKANNTVKGGDLQFKDNLSRLADRHGSGPTLPSEAARPSVITFGSQSSQKFSEISSHSSSSSLANLNGLQLNYRSLSTLNHKPQHNSSVVSKDRLLSSQGALSSSSTSLKSTAQVNRTTLGVPTM